jgi:ribosomal protein S4E
MVESMVCFNFSLNIFFKYSFLELKEKWIETVIPKGKGGKVMVLAGKYRGSVGRIVDRDDKKYKVWVALHESDDVVKVDFDDACEYVGYVQDLDLHED